MARKLAPVSLVLMAAFLAGCDHATKAVAKGSLRTVVTVVPGLFDLVYTENRNMAFSFLVNSHIPGKAVLLAVLSLGVLCGIALLWWKRRTAPMLEQVGYSFIVGGALGNLIDRIGRGYVIDFMHLHRWPVFNVADVALVLGIALMVLSSFRGNRGPGKLAPTSNAHFDSS
jgi:signal peptidase II